MKSEIKQLTAKNKANGFYFECENCGRIIAPMGARFILPSELKYLCDCGNPSIGENSLKISKSR